MLVIVFVGPENWSFGLTLGVLMVGTWLVAQVHARPYEVDAANRLEESSMIATILTWLIALHFYNDEPVDEAWKVNLETAIITLVHVWCVQTPKCAPTDPPRTRRPPG